VTVSKVIRFEGRGCDGGDWFEFDGSDGLRMGLYVEEFTAQFISIMRFEY
jgi:hypothetical protein